MTARQEDSMSGRPPDDVPPPLKSGSGVRWKQVLAGIAIGLFGANDLRLLLLVVAFSDRSRSEIAEFLVHLVFLLLPTAILVGAIFWAARVGWKGCAIGMAIYACVDGLLAGWLSARGVYQVWIDFQI